jgi:hypothetical protein
MKRVRLPDNKEFRINLDAAKTERSRLLRQQGRSADGHLGSAWRRRTPGDAVADAARGWIRPAGEGAPRASPAGRG